MKKIAAVWTFVVIFACCLFLFPAKSQAFHNLPYQTPVVLDGNTFTDYIQFFEYTTGMEYLVYCTDNNDATIRNTNNVVTGYYAPYWISMVLLNCNTASYGKYVYYPNYDYWGYNNWNAGSAYFDHTKPLADTVRTTVNLKNASNTWTFPSGGSAYGLTGAISYGQLLVSAGNNVPRGLTINRSPQMGGGVASLPEGDGIYCGLGGTDVCQLNFNQNSEVQLQAYPNTGWIFAYWDDGTNHITDNPYTFTMNGAKTMTAVFKRSLGWPLSGSQESRTILSDFGDDWIESCDGLIMKHTGIDISATINPADTVYAAESGTVKAAQTDQIWGGWVTLEHDISVNPYTTVYFHITPSVSVNAIVNKGDLIGTVVNYGGPIHLHFGLRNGAYTNTSNRGRLPQAICGGDPAFQENFEDPATFSFE